MLSLRAFLLSCLAVLPVMFVASPEKAYAYDYACNMSIKHDPPLGSGSFTTLGGFPKFYTAASDVAAIGVCQNDNNNEAQDHCGWHTLDHLFDLKHVIYRKVGGTYSHLVIDETVNWQCIDAYPYYAQLLSPEDEKAGPTLAQQLSRPALPSERRAPATYGLSPVRLYQSRVRFIGASAADVFAVNGNPVAVLPTLQSRMTWKRILTTRAD